MITAIFFLVEMFILYKAKIEVILCSVFGSLIHFFVLRGILIPSVSLYLEKSMYDLISNIDIIRWIDLGAFSLQLLTLSGFIVFVPLKTVKEVFEEKEISRITAILILFLSVYLAFNTYMFNVDYFSVELAVQQIVIVVAILTFFYLILYLLLRIMHLGYYKLKTEELEDQIDKDRHFTNAILNLAEIVIEANLTNGKVTRIMVDSIERPTEHLPPFNAFMKYQIDTFTHPQDISLIENITTDYLISCYDKNIMELNYEYRANKIEATHEDTGVMQISDDYLWYRMRIDLIHLSEEELNAFITIDEIHDEKQKEIALRNRAERDGLTGLYNKATIASKVNEHLKKGKIGALYMLDLDNFKSINDNMGHSAGDEVLMEVAHSISSIFRSKDLVGRIGGDEFVVFLLDTCNEEIISAKAKALCKVLNKKYHAKNGVDIEISSSIGIAYGYKDGNEFETLFHNADLAMYNSKSKGKNAYTIFDSNLHSELEQQTKTRK